MPGFAAIRKAALARHGEKELKSRLPKVKSPAALKKVAEGKPVLSILSSRGVGNEGLRYFSNLAGSSRGATIFVGRETKSKDAIGDISAVAGSRMKISYSNGTLFLQSKIPLSQLFGLTVNRRLGIPEIELEPMV